MQGPESMYQGQMAPSAAVDPLSIRDAQHGRPPAFYRRLRPDEIQTLQVNGCVAQMWEGVLVQEPFDASLVRNCRLLGTVRLGPLTPGWLTWQDVTLPIGVYDSQLADCDLGGQVAIHKVAHLAGVLVGEGVMLLDVGHITASTGATFGCGLQLGAHERSWIEPANENGRRAILAFAEMRPADAFLWARYRQRPALMERLVEMTDQSGAPGPYGTIGAASAIVGCRAIRNVHLGPRTVVDCAAWLCEATVRSTADSPVFLGPGVQLERAIVGPGCRITQAAQASHVILGENVTLERGCRVSHSVVGDNSTIACCEVLHSLLGPAHEQHHNNSFLIAATVAGQSNIAAGATIGSNHNSRSPDGEILAERGFWPGLCVSLKHNSRFAAYTLLAKGDYPCEISNPLPFALISQDLPGDRLQVMPAYWWLYNMYALARNRGKFARRDRRKVKAQAIEFDPLAPDTAQAMLAARDLLARGVGQAQLRAGGASGVDDDELIRRGRLALENASPERSLEVLAEGVEFSRRPVVVLKAFEGYRAYGHMLLLYGAGALLDAVDAQPQRPAGEVIDEIRDLLPCDRWEYLGGQVLAGSDVEALIGDIEAGRLSGWREVHQRLDDLARQYPRRRARHALGVLEALGRTVDSLRWRDLLDDLLQLQRELCRQVELSRAKDYDSPARQVTFDDPAQRQAVLGDLEGDSFVAQVRQETDALAQRIADAADRW